MLSYKNVKMVSDTWIQRNLPNQLINVENILYGIMKNLASNYILKSQNIVKVKVLGRRI
jgi:hypothetical protein